MKKPLTKLVLSISLLLFVASQLSAQSEHPSLFKNLDETEYEKGIVVFRVKSEQKSLSNQGGVYSKGFERFAKGRKIKSIGQAYPHVKQLKKSICDKAPMIPSLNNGIALLAKTVFMCMAHPKRSPQNSNARCRFWFGCQTGLSSGVV